MDSPLLGAVATKVIVLQKGPLAAHWNTVWVAMTSPTNVRMHMCALRVHVCRLTLVHMGLPVDVHTALATEPVRSACWIAISEARPGSNFS
jgi:hypothetical protein